MSKSIFRLELVQFETWWAPPPTLPGREAKFSPAPVSDQAKDDFLLKVLEDEAKKTAIDVERNSERKRKVPRGGLRKPGAARSGPRYIGGMPGTTLEIIHVVTYVAGSVAAFAVFLNNVLGVAKHWCDLRAARTIRVTVGEKTIRLKEGDDLQGFIDEANKLIKFATPPDSPSK